MPGKRKHLMNMTVVVHTTERPGEIVLSCSTHTHDPFDTRHMPARIAYCDDESAWAEVFSWLGVAAGEQLDRLLRSSRSGSGATIVTEVAAVKAAQRTAHRAAATLYSKLHKEANDKGE